MEIIQPRYLRNSVNGFLNNYSLLIKALSPRAERATLDTPAAVLFILKGWKSLSPGLRGTSYPGGWRTSNLNPERVLSKTLNRYSPAVARILSTPGADAHRRLKACFHTSP